MYNVFKSLDNLRNEVIKMEKIIKNSLYGETHPEKMQEIFEKLNEDNKSVITMVARGMELAQKERR